MPLNKNLCSVVREDSGRRIKEVSQLNDHKNLHSDNDKHIYMSSEYLKANGYGLENSDLVFILHV